MYAILTLYAKMANQRVTYLKHELRPTQTFSNEMTVPDIYPKLIAESNIHYERIWTVYVRLCWSVFLVWRG